MPGHSDYDSKHLTTHAVCVGMTGSGKTGLCLSLLEEAALDGIPAIAIDPKGDLGNLLLAFPELEPSDFRPWIETSEAARQQMSPDEFAASQAELWRKGLAKWDEGPGANPEVRRRGRARDLHARLQRRYSDHGPEVVSRAAAGARCRWRCVSRADCVGDFGLAGAVGHRCRPGPQPRAHFSVERDRASWRDGRDLDLAQLIQQIQRPPFDKIGVIDLESFYPAKDRTHWR